MAYHIEKETGDLVIYGFETGIAPSPHKGMANMQNVNISTESGEVMVSFARTQQSMTSTSSTGTLSFLDSTHLNLDISGSNDRFKGTWISVSGSSHGGELGDGTYWVTLSSGNGYQLSATYNGSAISGYTAGLTATISMIRNMTTPVAWAQEKYGSTSSIFYRYYVLDSQGLVWLYDTANEVLFNPTDNVTWILPDTTINYFGSDTAPSGIAVLNGWVMVFTGNRIFVKATVRLSTSPGWVAMDNAWTMGKSNNPNPHFALVGHQGKLYYTDGVFVGSIFPDTSLLTSQINVQSYASYTTSTTTGTISSLISGSIPWTASDSVGTVVRIPAVFFAATGGAIPSALTANVVYYIEYSIANGTFTVFAAATGGSAKDITSGASGTQYFNTFYPIGTHAGAFGDTSTCTFTPQRLNLPNNEIAQCLVEVGNTVIVGGNDNVLYPWNQVDATPSSLIFLPEKKTTSMVTVNQMAYIFAGNRGNVYITDGSVASLVIKVPDYCAGIAGTESSYVEPYFTWGGAMYLRGRVYFSMLDQTSTKAGNCGGIWSFVPTQNLYIGQDTGLALRLENRNSYGTYSGVATVLIPAQNQTAKSPQYWSAWYSSIFSATYGIDFTHTKPTDPALIETDLIPTGTLLGKQKQTYSNIEYKLAAPLVAGESVAFAYRLNATDAYVSCGTIQKEGTTEVSGYNSPLPFQNTQWLQFQVTAHASDSTAASFVRLKEIRLRQ